MEIISIIEGFHPENDARLLKRAEELTPLLFHSIAEPVGAFKLKERYSREKEEIALQSLPDTALEKGQNLCLDFGNHYVGYPTLYLSFRGSHPDAPAFLKLKFAETMKELGEKSHAYDGWISSSWIQEEFIHIDTLPAQIKLPKRYAFRYLKITVLDTSPKYKLTVRRAECLTETSANRKDLETFSSGDAMLDQIYRVSLRTLENCMQDVFEDGPKRDRRLWMGDLRLQALTNYVSFRNNDLVKRCLYLFGGSRFPDGRISACLFTKPAAEADDTYMFDYALFYVVALEEYLQETEDAEALGDLYDIAMRQIELSLQQSENSVITEQAADTAFIDWCDGLSKTACAQAILIYAMRYAHRLAVRKGDLTYAGRLSEQIESLKKAARDRFWDARREYFVSNGQVSAASQIWMVLADVLTTEEAERLMVHSDEFLQNYPMTTPYMHHFYLMALLRAGLREKAMEHLKAYWGSMIESGADTFPELWDPAHPDSSPYGGSVINSYCHAWSCTPAYLIRRFFCK